MNKKNPYHCFSFESEKDGRQFSPSAKRNGPYILDVLKTFLPSKGTILEIAAGTGEHVIYFASQLKHLNWLPSDPACDKIESICAWMKYKPSNNISTPVKLDAADKSWLVEDMNIDPPIIAIVCINMIHVAPWKAGQGLLSAAGRILPKGGILYLYGAYKINGVYTAPSNEEFDKLLKKTDSEWGLRDLLDVEKEAAKHDLKLKKVIDMPANNLSVIFVKQ